MLRLKNLVKQGRKLLEKYWIDIDHENVRCIARDTFLRVQNLPKKIV